MRPPERGFSLLELLVVLAMISGILILAAPRLAGSLDTLLLKRSSRELAAALKQTRLQAIRSGKQSELILYLNRHEYAFDWNDKRQTLSEDINISLITTASAQKAEDVGAIRFYPDGSATGGEIVLAQDGVDYSVQVDWLTGRVRIYD